MSRISELLYSEAVDADRVLAAYPVEFQPRRIENLGSAGGFSGARFSRLQTPRGLLCLRRWPVEHPNAETLAFIHAVLEHVHSRGFVAVALPIRTLVGETFFSLHGHLWELTPWLPGAANYLPERKPEKLAAAMTALGRWHLAAAEFPQSDRQPAVSPTILSRRDQLERLRSGGLTRLSSAVKVGALERPEWAELARLAERLFALFFPIAPIIAQKLSSAASIRVPLQPCIRDVWHDHVLFEEDQVSGLIDFGALRLDTVAGDVARLLGSMASDDLEAWEHGLAAYQAMRPLSDDELALVRVFDESAMLISSFNWLEWVFISQREFENPAEVARRVTVILDRLEFFSRFRSFAIHRWFDTTAARAVEFIVPRCSVSLLAGRVSDGWPSGLRRQS